MIALYHFTDLLGSVGILAEGQIDVFPWGMEGLDTSGHPDVAWFQASRHRHYPKGFRRGDGDWKLPRNTEIRFEVRVSPDDAVPWRTWARRHGLSAADCAGVTGGRSPRWYVTERPVPASEWVSVCWAANGRPLVVAEPWLERAS